MIKRGLTTQEREALEIGLARNILDEKNCCECPTCNIIIVKKIHMGIKINCINCQNKGMPYQFCYRCGREWKNKDTSSYDVCGNDECIMNSAQNIATADM